MTRLNQTLGVAQVQEQSVSTSAPQTSEDDLPFDPDPVQDVGVKIDEDLADYERLLNA